MKRIGLVLLSLLSLLSPARAGENTLTRETPKPITKSATGADHFSVSAPESATAGTPFNFTVTALDQFNNIAAGYTGTVHFSLGSIWNSPSCSSTDVRNTIESASDGDTVSIPAGTCSWTETVMVNKRITIQGAGSSASGTVINVAPGSSSSQPAGGLNIQGEVTVRNIRWTGTSYNGNGMINLGPGTNNFRITGCYFDNGGSDGGILFVEDSSGNPAGVIDHNTFYPSSVIDYNSAIRIHGYEPWNGGTPGQTPATWFMDSTLGSANNIFIEDNVFRQNGDPPGGHTHAVYADQGGGFVFRHNTVTNGKVDVHGNCTSGPAREYEIYANTFNYTYQPDNWASAKVRGGTGVIYDNVVNSGGFYVHPIELRLQEVDDGTICNVVLGDGPCHCLSSSSCPKTIGRGKIDATNPGGVLDPAYFWNNTLDGAQYLLDDRNAFPDLSVACSGGQPANQIINVNRDYYSSASTRKPGYFPYTYPHPLTSPLSSLGTLPPDSVLTNGAGTFPATFFTAGNETISAADTVNASIAGSSNPIAVAPAGAARFSVTAPASATAGKAFSFTVTAMDPYGNIATSYTGRIHFTSTDSAAALPPDSSLTNGTGIFTATLMTTGNMTITATDTANAAIIGTSNSISVSPGDATHFSISAPGSANAGTAFSFAVTALDQFNKTVTGYTGTVHFTSTDGAATLPANSILINGTGSFSATLKTAGNNTIGATDTVNTSITGTSNAISVSPAAAVRFSVSAPASATAGTSFSFSVTALDQFNNTATGYTGTVNFTSTDPSASLPGKSKLTSGKLTFSATLKTAGFRTITATDTVNASITGTSNSITVSAADATHFSVSAPGSAKAGIAFSYAVTALDKFNNTATQYAGTVHFTSTDPGATLPANSALISGKGTFSAILRTQGAQKITATDTANSSITGKSGPITVSR